jgi:two-component system, NarL family, sensor kinase
MKPKVPILISQAHPVKTGYCISCKKSWKKGTPVVRGNISFVKLSKLLYFLRMKIASTLFLAVFYYSSICTAQTPAIDSLQKIINNIPDDSAKVNKLNDIAARLQYIDPVRAAVIIQQAIVLSEKTNYTLGLATAYRIRGVFYIDRTILDSGKIFYDKAWALVKDKTEKPFRKQAGLLTHNYGVINHHLQQYDKATARYLEAVKIYREIGEEGMMFFPFTNLSNLYTLLGDNQRALTYARECYTAAKKLNDPNKIIISINAICSAQLLLKQYDSVYRPLHNNLAQAYLVKNWLAVCKAHNMLGEYFVDGAKQFDSGVYHNRKSLEFATLLNNQYEMAVETHNIGHAYKMWGKYDSATAYFNKGMAMSKPLQLDQIVQYCLSGLVDVGELSGNFNNAFKYLKEYLVVIDSVKSRNNRAQVNELEAKYQSEKKELLITKLESDKKAQQLVNYALTGGAAAILIVSLLGYRNYKQKQKLQQQRIKELETQQQLLAAEAVLKGEEKERTRLAKDLHDGLGGMLSGIKYSFNNMRENLVMTPENQLAFERSMDMLDSSIKEMRRVAHNMMPEALVKFGLDTALKDFCNDINQSGALRVKYQSIGMDNATIDQTTAIAIFRVTQELVNNIIKHAAAATAIVQVTKTDGHIAITVEDDGKGFDTAILRTSKGIGWDNIQSRVDYLKGTIDTQSSPGKGTSVHIELTT